MPRCYFDIRENGELAVDELGMELAGLEAAQAEAIQSLNDMARDLPADADRHELAIEVRTDAGPLFSAAFVYQLRRN